MTVNKPSNEDSLSRSVRARKVTTDEVAYRDGYVQGKAVEQAEQQRLRAERAETYARNAHLRTSNNNAGGLFGILAIVLLAGIAGGLLFYATDDGPEPLPASNTEQPAPEAESNETTIIERTIERTQEVVPAPAEVNPPDIEVNIPAPAAPEAGGNNSGAEQPAPAESSQAD